MTARQVVGRPVEEACRAWPALLQRLTSGQPVAAGEEIAHWRTPERVFVAAVSPLPEGRGRSGQMVILHDVTRRHEVERSRREQERLRTLVEDQEMLARELHDRVGQMMGYVITETLAARRHITEGQLELAGATLAHLAESAQDAHAGLRDFALGLPGERGGQGAREFMPALAGYLARCERLFGLSVHLRSSGCSWGPWAE